MVNSAFIVVRHGRTVLPKLSCDQQQNIGGHDDRHRTIPLPDGGAAWQFRRENHSCGIWRLSGGVKKQRSATCDISMTLPLRINDGYAKLIFCHLGGYLTGSFPAPRIA